LVKEFKVKKIQGASRGMVTLNGHTWLPKEVRTAMAVVVKESLRYLERYRDMYDKTKKVGDSRIMCRQTRRV